MSNELYKGHFVKFEDILKIDPKYPLIEIISNGSGKTIITNSKTINFIKNTYEEIRKTYFYAIHDYHEDYTGYIYGMCTNLLYSTGEITRNLVYEDPLSPSASIFYYALIRVIDNIISKSTIRDKFESISKEETIEICNILLHSLDLDYIYLLDEFNKDEYEAYVNSYTEIFRYDTKIAEYVETIVAVNFNIVLSDKLLKDLSKRKHDIQKEP